MNLIQQTEEEAVILQLQDKADTIARLIHTAVIHMKAGYDLLWDMPEDRLVAVLNALGPAKVQLLFESNTIHGTSLNALLDSMAADNPPQATLLTARVTLIPGRQVGWNAEAATFEIIPAEPEN